MLVLDRKPGQQILVGDDVIIEVVKVRGDKVKIGIAAPKATVVHRREVYDAIKKEAKLAELEENQNL